jgi:hypothetical protein
MLTRRQMGKITQVKSNAIETMYPNFVPKNDLNTAPV